MNKPFAFRPDDDIEKYLNQFQKKHSLETPSQAIRRILKMAKDAKLGLA